MKDYQTKLERARLPRDVYMQVLWTIRGYERMKKELEDIIDGTPDRSQPHSNGGTPGSPVEAKAGKRDESGLDKVRAIEKALDSIPEEYRRGVWNKVIHNEPYPDDANVSTYSRYKGEFVLRTAKYLGMF